eukprot:15351266-Ditylum_brightwellii.AAC.1
MNFVETQLVLLRKSTIIFGYSAKSLKSRTKLQKTRSLSFWERTLKRQKRKHCVQFAEMTFAQLKADEDIWNEALGALVKASSMDERVARLPLDSQAERLEVFRSLFIENDLDVGATSRALDNFLYMNNWRLWGVKDLSWQQKEEIYNDARRPVLKLEAELKETQEKCDAAAGKDKQESQRLDRKLKDIEQKLRFAKQNAEEDVFARINASGSMGTLNCRGNIQLDFHGLHVKEAKQKFEEIVLPVLP